MRLNIEYKIMTSLAPDYDKLPPLHKLEVFETALAQTDGQVMRGKRRGKENRRLGGGGVRGFGL